MPTNPAPSPSQMMASTGEKDMGFARVAGRRALSPMIGPSHMLDVRRAPLIRDRRSTRIAGGRMNQGRALAVVTLAV